MENGAQQLGRETFIPAMPDSMESLCVRIAELTAKLDLMAQRMDKFGSILDMIDSASSESGEDD